MNTERLMENFIALGVLRHLQGMHTLREQVQSLLHLELGEALRAPLARSNWSAALFSKRWGAVLAAVLSPLLFEARAVLPDRLVTGRTRSSARAGYAVTTVTLWVETWLAALVWIGFLDSGTARVNPGGCLHK